MTRLQQQAGLGLISLVFWLGLGGLVIILGLKATPIISENLTVKQAISHVIKQRLGTDEPTIRAAVNNYLHAGYAAGFNANELLFERQNGVLVVGYDYQRKIELFGPVSILFEYRDAQRVQP